MEEEADGEWKSRKKTKRRKAESWRNDDEEAGADDDNGDDGADGEDPNDDRDDNREKIIHKAFYSTFASDNYNRCGRLKYWLQDLR